MIYNYILISLRNLRKHLSFTVINITGLGLGLSICLLLVLWIRHETSYDNFHDKSERIYRVSLEYGFGGQVARTAVSPTALLPAITSLPETETGVRFYNPSSENPIIVATDNERNQERKFCFADSTFFNVFSFNLIKGNPEKALTEPYSLILTESAAARYFGNDDPMGKLLTINNSQPYTVTGVVKDPPANSFIQFEFLASFHSLRAGREQPIWWSANYQTFCVLNEKADFDALVTKTNDIVTKTLASELSGPGDYVRYNFIPLRDIHLHSDFDHEPEVVGSIQYVYIFTAIALLILAIACINYVNLATARATERAKEVGIRKVVGALRKQLFSQFIGESVIITFLGFLLAFGLAYLLLPFFNELTGQEFSLDSLTDPVFIGYLAVGMIFIAIAAGIYPAMVITSFKAVSVLKGNFKSSARGIGLRKFLVVVQFTISMILIVGTFVISKQLNYIQDKRLGFDKENTLILPLDGQTNTIYESLKTELMRTGSVTRVARGSDSPAQVGGGYSIALPGMTERGIMITGLIADEEYIPTLGLELLRGRNFTAHDVERQEKDTVYTFILNEAAVKELHLTLDDAVGKPASMGSRRGEIIGVVHDFHHASMHAPISPLVIFPEMPQTDQIFVKISSGDVARHIENVKSVFTNLVPHRPFEFQFLDAEYASLYNAEQRIGKVFIVFAVLAIVIASMGLLGLVAFSAAQKTKEIGIRKVLGATATSIVVLITRDFARLVIISIVIGLPVAYWLMEQWLGDFAYRTNIGTMPLVLAAVLCLAIAIITASYHALKSALVNPADTLRSE